MNRLYILPKIFIITFIILYLYQTLDILSIIITFLIATIIVIFFEVLRIYLLGKYYLYKVKKGKKVNRYRIAHFINYIIKTVNYFMRVQTTVYHLERFDPNKTYLITPNHQSNADVTILLEVINHPLTFVAKIALSRVFLIRDWMKLIGSLYLDKNNMREQIKVMKEVEKRLNNQESVVIFPEGKRSFTWEMNDFKSGTFKVSTQTEVDILPVTLNHVYKIRKHFPWKTTHVEVYFHEAIPYEVYKDMNTQEVAAMVQKIVASKIQTN